MSSRIARQGFLCLALGLLVLAARAETVKGLYEADVPVASQDEQARAVAVDTGFRQVLVKVAGSARSCASMSRRPTTRPGCPVPDRRP